VPAEIPAVVLGKTLFSELQENEKRGHGREAQVVRVTVKRI
jgi:hypothetical protein